MIQAEHLHAIREQMSEGNYSKAASLCLAALRKQPKDPETVELYGTIAVKLGRVTDAIIIFKKLLALSPDHAYAHDRLASLYYTEGNHGEAKTHAVQALQLNAGLVTSYLVAGSILLEEKKEPEALETFEIARQVHPGNLNVEHAYAQALQQNGQFDRAAVVLRDAISKDENAPALHLLLANSRKMTADDPDAALVLALRGDNGELNAALLEDKETEAVANLALFKVESDLGNHAQAFVHLKAAKDIRRQQYAYDPETRDSGVSLLGKIFTPRFFAERVGLGSDVSDPIFVIGMPRSGTTLLERVIANHKEVEAAGELPHIPRLIHELCAEYASNQYDLRGFSNAPAPVWKELAEEYLRRARLQTPENRHFVDKLPGNYHYLGFIRTILPNAKIVHISRHPMANCLSIYEQDFRAKHGYCNDLRATGLVYLDYAEIMGFWRKLFGEHIIEISYESLVSHPEESAQWLRAQLKLDDNLGELRSTQEAGVIRTASQWQARQPIHAQSIDRWQELRRELQPLEETLAPLLQSHRT